MRYDGWMQEEHTIYHTQRKVLVFVLTQNATVDDIVHTAGSADNDLGASELVGIIAGGGTTNAGHAACLQVVSERVDDLVGL